MEGARFVMLVMVELVTPAATAHWQVRLFVPIMVLGAVLGGSLHRHGA